MKQRKWRGLLCLQILGVLFLTCMIVKTELFPWKMEVDLRDFSSEVMTYEEEPGRWTLEAGGLTSLPARGEVILNGPYLRLHPGSYTLEMECDTDEDAICSPWAYSSKNSVAANDFYISSLRPVTVYHFYVKLEASGLTFPIQYAGRGNFTLSRVAVRENSANWRLLLLVWLAATALVRVWKETTFFQRNRRTCLELGMIVFFSTLPILTRGMSPGHDFGFHAQRIEGIAQGILHGEFPVRLETSFNGGYGFPVSVYYGSLLLYFPALLRILGFSVYTAYKLYVVLINVLTTATAYLCCRKIFRKQETCTLAAAAYVTGNYRLTDLYVRAAVGETASFVFFPVIALALWQIYAEPDDRRDERTPALLLATGLLGILYSHLLSLEICGVVLLLIALALFKRTFRARILRIYLKASLYFLVGGMAFIVPFLDYFLSVNTLVRGGMVQYVPLQWSGTYVADLFAFFRNTDGKVSSETLYRLQLTPGLLLMLGALVAFCLMVLGRADRKLRTLFWICAGLFFLSSAYFPWDMLIETTRIGRILVQVQFLTRYIGPLTAALMLLAGMVMETMDQKGILTMGRLFPVSALLLVLAVSAFTGAYLQSARQTHRLDSAELEEYTFGLEGYAGMQKEHLNGTEYLMEGTSLKELTGKIASENVQASVVSERGLHMEVQAVSSGQGWLEVPRFNYPHYQVRDESGKLFPIENGTNNTIRIRLDEPFEGRLVVDFVEPWTWRLSEICSAFFLLWVMAGIARRKRRTEKEA